MTEGMESTERYPNIDTMRWIVDVSRSGDWVVLDDGSKWHVVPSHRMRSGSWPRTLKIRVSPVQGRLYTLGCEDEHEVQAVYQGFRPIHDEPHVNGQSHKVSNPTSSGSQEREVDPAASAPLKSEA